MLVVKNFVLCLLFAVMAASVSNLSAQPDLDDFNLEITAEDSVFILEAGIIREKTERLKDYAESLGLVLSWNGYSGSHVEIFKSGETVLQFFAHNFTVMDVIVDEEKNVILKMPPFISCRTGIAQDTEIDLIVKKEVLLEEKVNSLYLVIKPTGELYFESLKLSGEKIVYDL
jgi:hypothetical protein